MLANFQRYFQTHTNQDIKKYHLPQDRKPFNYRVIEEGEREG